MVEPATNNPPTSRQPEWTFEQVIQLIQEYAKRPSLWNPECEDYKNRAKKQDDWMEIANVLQCNKAEAERKMNILSSQYRREKRKQLVAQRAGAKFRSFWYGFKYFEFLDKCKRQRHHSKTVDGEQQPQTSLPNRISQLPLNQQKILMHIIPSKMVYQPQVSMKNEVTYEEDEENVQDCAESVSQQTEQVEQEIERNSGGRDEFDCFGESVAYTLRKLHSDKLRCIVKNDINKILYEAEMSRYK